MSEESGDSIGQLPPKINIPPKRTDTQATAVPSPTTHCNHLNKEPTYAREGHAADEIHWRPESQTDDFLDQYFVGPRDLDRHSKLPLWMRVHGSVLPQMIVPLTIVGSWATLITCISSLTKSNLGISNVLLTVLGFVVGLALSFRSTTAYERYAEGRKYFGLLSQTSRNLARQLWMHVSIRENENEKDDLLRKLSAINLILAFSVALKHRLRFEPHIHYEDLHGLIAYLDTFAKAAFEPEDIKPVKQSSVKATGMYLGVPMFFSNPQKAIKRSQKPIGNLPLEILTHLSAYVEKISDDNLCIPIMLSQIHVSVAQLNEVLTGSERVLHTPLPAAYSILFSQITWIYVMVLPFQLFPTLQWITIPATLVAAYIIIGIATIGNELENPFGRDVNDLPLDNYCRELSQELDIMTASKPLNPTEFMENNFNMPLYPLSMGGYEAWKNRSVDEIFAALKAKSVIARNDERRNRNKVIHSRTPSVMNA